MDNALVWVGSFEGEADFKAYANHNRKKCPWRDDFPIGYEGATYLETFRAPGESLRHALVRLYFSAGYLDPVLAELDRLGIAEGVNGVKVVMVPKRGMRKVDTSGWADVEGPLRYLGAYEVDDDTPLRHPEDKGIPQVSQAGFVSVWIGSLADADAAEEYMEEVYPDEEADEEHENQPLSPFGKDWRLCYDHDFLYHEVHDKPRPVAKLLEGWKGSEAFAKPATKAAKQAGITKGNLVVVAYDLDYTAKPPFSTSDPAGYWRQKGKPRAKSPLTFVGTFRFDGSSP